MVFVEGGFSPSVVEEVAYDRWMVFVEGGFSPSVVGEVAYGR